MKKGLLPTLPEPELGDVILARNWNGTGDKLFCVAPCTLRPWRDLIRIVGWGDEFTKLTEDEEAAWRLR